MGQLRCGEAHARLACTLPAPCDDQPARIKHTFSPPRWQARPCHAVQHAIQRGLPTRKQPTALRGIARYAARADERRAMSRVQGGTCHVAVARRCSRCWCNEDLAGTHTGTHTGAPARALKGGTHSEADGSAASHLLAQPQTVWLPCVAVQPRCKVLACATSGSAAFIASSRHAVRCLLNSTKRSAPSMSAPAGSLFPDSAAELPARRTRLRSSRMSYGTFCRSARVRRAWQMAAC